MLRISASLKKIKNWFSILLFCFMDSPIVVQLKLFASCREIAGISSCDIKLTSESHTVLDLINQVVDLYPDLSDSVNEMSVAVNKKYITEKDYLLSNNDIVAFIPPISGG